MFKKGDVVTIQTLNKKFDRHAPAVLHDHLRPRPRAKGAQRSYDVLKALPSPDEYRALRDARFTTTVGAAVTDACAIFEELADELEAWYENLPESLQSGDKGSQLEEAKDALQGLEQPDVPDGLDDVKLVALPPTSRDSRAARRDEAVSLLSAAKDALEELDFTEENDGSSPAPPAGVTAEDAEALADALQNLIDDAEGVDFPGMY